MSKFFRHKIQVFLSAICVIIFMLNAYQCTAYTKTNTPIKLQLKWRNQFQFAGYYAAKIKGYYADKGLDVTILPGGPGISPVDNVISGKADFGVFDPGILLKEHTGKPLVVLATIMQSSGYCIISLKSKNILKPSDLVGKKVLVERNQGWSVFKAILLKEGISLDNIQIIDRKKDSEEILNNQADAVVTYIASQPQRITSMGYQINIMRPEEYGVDFYGDILFTTREVAYKDTKRTDDFIEASLKGWKYALSHQDELIDYILTLPDVKAYGVTREELKYEAREIEKLIMPQLVEIGHSNLGRWQYMLTLFQKLGIADKEFSLKNFLYDSEQNTYSRWLLPIIYVLIIILIGIVIVMLINLQLRKSVAIKTAELRTEIEQRKLAEQLANESKEQIELILNSSNIGLWDIELAENKTSFNQQFKEILGYPKSYNFSEEDFFKKIHPEDLSSAQKIFTPLQENTTLNKMVQFRLEDAKGEYIHVLSSSKLLFDNDKPFKTSGVLLSINELKQKESEILKVSEELVRRNNELKKFAYITSHNLRGPVVNISALSEMVNTTALDVENALIFEKIKESIYKLENTLDDLIEVVSQEKVHNHNIVKFNIEEQINSVIHAIENQIKESGITFNFDLQVTEIAYPKHYFESIILNLITNAIKYRSPSRLPVVHIKSFAKDEYIVLKFSDNGIGIDLSKNKSKIFGLYQRFNTEIKGKGIGLFIIKSHIDSLNGKIEVDSVLGEGTTFTISFQKTKST
nr:ABC transporter substrate-binding protein [uncultured Pedobacter sp.]